MNGNVVESSAADAARGGDSGDGNEKKKGLFIRSRTGTETTCREEGGAPVR